MIQKKKISLEFLSKIKEINDLLEMHRSILSKDPLIKLSKYKGLLFYFLAHEYGNNDLALGTLIGEQKRDRF